MYLFHTPISFNVYDSKYDYQSKYKAALCSISYNVF